MKRLPTLAALVGAAMSLSSLSLSAQEIEATVTANADNLSAGARQDLAGFADELQRYVSSIRWTTGEWEGDKVRMNFSVVFTGEGSGGLYEAKLLVGSMRGIHKSDATSPMMRVLDDNWTFRYSRNQTFQQNTASFDDLTGIIDFYVYMALGLDLDSYGYLGGQSMFDRAREIAQRASMRNDLAGWSTDVPPGKYSRYGFVREFTDIRYQPLRKYIFDYHYNGIDLLAENRSAGLDSINTHLTDLVRAIDRLVEPSVIVRVLNDSKHMELSELFVGYRDDVVWRKLAYIDPGHKSVYEAARDKSH